MTNAELSARRSAAIARGVGVATPIFAERAKNAELWDSEGNRYIDFAGGIAVVNTGHSHPRVVEAVKTQIDHFSHTCHQVAPYENYVELAERLNAAAPGDFAKKTLFATTGAEAVENAVKIARAFTGRQGVIAFSGGFHGRTFMGMSLTGKVQPYKAGFGAMPGDVWHVPFPMAPHGITADDSMAAIEGLFKSDVDPARVAAIIIEPVQGEGGFYPAPAELMTALRALCDKHGILLIADEVQTGFARTGKLFAMQHYDVAPDLTTMAKSLAGGYPLSGVVGRAEVMDAPQPGGLGGTYGGSPLGIAAALAVMDVIRDEDLCARAQKLGDALKSRLSSLRNEVPELADVRGPGFMVAAEFIDADGTPLPQMATAVRDEAMSRGLILLTCGVYGNVIRFLSPITIEDAIFDEALDALSESLRAAKAAQDARAAAA
ncbi:4-aminobutyrate--2-oxoglutarate transaminase [Paracoccus sp. R12_1]|uniref:4-aminobutyrate--2-oxoglutarate transaminase n=1 Tax=unclassified Paracoccus (in: a-proteobacteria) TaxID=2688777 RepID=UPI000C09766D|nr:MULTISPECIES: 4-aminobutyrate--2-oxoglutarate transaminase [unclassified Paracoccus (in: a-proteobacteria)]MBO9453584.1 4-aminobutyrate--2-oxoglutarate transaminase [Paracoccus sp. R12_2]MBO9486992.1 4-aminobutyrate--2-oxoglutarate transaminase [Paracoccus sp. R12_1]PHQ70972.1 MAG: 4-aminobutyrate--2-oxoglutarate transaminase [Paracoccus sp. (in: a-proteobacteria)]